MKTEVLEKYELKHIYLREFQLFTSDADITFNIVDINTDKMTITLAVTNVGKISVITYDLLTDKFGISSSAPDDHILWSFFMFYTIFRA